MNIKVLVTFFCNKMMKSFINTSLNNCIIPIQRASVLSVK